MKWQINIFIMSVVAFSALSCSKFTYGGTEGDETVMHVNVSGADPEHVYTVMASRLVNSIHYVWKDTLSQKIRHGEYYTAAFYADPDVYVIDKVKGDEKEALERFAADKSMSMQEVYVSLPFVEDSEYGKLADYNPYSFFIKSADGLLACDFKKVSALDTAMTVNFTPRMLTQHLTFRLTIEPEAGVTVTGLQAAVSGVAGKVRVMSGLVRNDSQNPTYRQYVEMEKVSQTDRIVYEGTANVLGLFPPSSSVYTSGPGIFQVEVSASVESEETVYTRVFHVGINLKSVIEKAGLMEEAKDKSGYRIKRTEAVLEVPVALNISHDKVVSGEGEGHEQWFEHENSDLEFEI